MTDRWDPRLYQIASLTGLLVYGMGWLEFDVTPGRCAVLLATSLGTQWAFCRYHGLRFDWRSPLISALSLCLLLRTNYTGIAMLGAFVAIGSKFTLRANDKHIFNPTNIGLVVTLLTGLAWVSPGQWGSATFLAFLFACAGGLVVNRAERSDVTIAALAFFAAVVFGRSWWLGEPMAIPIHRIQSGAFLLFAFFMISDPKTTPDSRLGRILFAGLVALGAGYVHFVAFRTNGLIWSLAAFSLLVPLLDRLMPGGRFQWPGLPRPTNEVSKWSPPLARAQEVK